MSDSGRGTFDESADLPRGYDLIRYPDGGRQILTYDGELINLNHRDDPKEVVKEYQKWHSQQEESGNGGFSMPDKNSDRLAELEKQQQQTRQYVERSIEQVEREQPKQEKQKERSEERER